MIWNTSSARLTRRATIVAWTVPEHFIPEHDCTNEHICLLQRFFIEIYIYSILLKEPLQMYIYIRQYIRVCCWKRNVVLIITNRGCATFHEIGCVFLRLFLSVRSRLPLLPKIVLPSSSYVKALCS